ncbi:RING finger protein 37 [Ischnura elegans]|uniref:RING finger protein 37 n=1 Tax=Ischnura elegans TaxID=197161 RepID=UPI001ED889BE|nr:RING finger protein 37 [Ischnura elegans]
MALNFCTARLKTKISTSAVSSEGHEVTNLLSTLPGLQSRGFLTEGFCKPPVSIHLKFLCHVDINHIILWVEVGCQKSNGVELLAVKGNDVYGDKYEEGYSQDSAVSVRIGSCKINSESGVLFQNYNCWATPKAPENFLKRFFTSSASYVLRNCSDLEIKIFSTANSSVPSLKRVEVWGRPGRYCPGDLKHDLYSWWNQPSGSPENVPKSEPHEEVENSTIHSSTPSTSDDVSELVPEEFLDPITLNVMAIPMTLPCGKTVDLSTLEKFELAEAKWGRGPSDPFTGVPFSQSLVPIPDTALKSRIDRFLCENGHLPQFKCVPRTVGRKKPELNQFPTVRSMNVQKSVCGETSGGASSSGSQKNSLMGRSVGSSVQGAIPHKCHPETSGLRDSDGGITPEYSVGGKTQLQRGLKRKRTMNEASSSILGKGIAGSIMTSHEDAIENSLDCALQSVLTGLPSFIKTNPKSLGETYQITAKCERSSCLSKDCLFSLPCRHLLCRICLVEKSSKNMREQYCEVCHNHYDSSEVVRFHS